MRKLLSLLIALFAVVSNAKAESLGFCNSADRAVVAGDYAWAITDFSRCQFGANSVPIRSPREAKLPALKGEIGVPYGMGQYIHHNQLK